MPERKPFSQAALTIFTDDVRRRGVGGGGVKDIQLLESTALI